jgi:ATP-dependent exoDNAse (exonuclease V) alpha subunit
MLTEGFKEAEDYFETEEKVILSALKAKQLSKQDALVKVSELEKAIKVQQNLETDFDSEYDSSDPLFEEDFNEALSYALLFKRLDRLKMQISKMLLPDV